MSPSASSSLPRALVSRDALRVGAWAALAAGGSIVDLRADAWGHGAIETARIVMDAGAEAVRVDADDLDALQTLGVPATASATPDVDLTILYGLPGAQTRPAMTLTGTVMSTKPLHPGDGVSYGYLHRAQTQTRVALVTGGYAQGIVRALGNRARVEVDGALHPIVGRVAMDVCVVDVGDAEVAAGATVTFFGGSGPAQRELSTWVAATGLTAAELICAIGLHASREHTA